MLREAETRITAELATTGGLAPYPDHHWAKQLEVLH
jgi:hypothetical protein